MKKIDYIKLLNENYKSTNIDYLQLDCDPPNITFDILSKIPFDNYKFGVITYEHDHYNDITGKYREKSREFLKGDDNHTLGRSLRIQFLDSKIDGEAPMLDRKKSGDYLIFATQHMFTGNRARTRLLLGRLGHLGVQTAAGEHVRKYI